MQGAVWAAGAGGDVVTGMPGGPGGGGVPGAEAQGVEGFLLDFAVIPLLAGLVGAAADLAGPLTASGVYHA